MLTKKQNKTKQNKTKQKVTLMMTSAHVIKTSVNVTTNSPSQDCIHPNYHIMTGLLGSNHLQKNKNKTQKTET